MYDVLSIMANMLEFKNKKRSGSAILLALMIMLAILSGTLYINILSIRSMIQARNIDNSVVAFYGAETGNEQAIYYIKKTEDLDIASLTVESGTGEGIPIIESLFSRSVTDEVSNIYISLSKDEVYQLDSFDQDDLNLGSSIDHIILDWDDNCSGNSKIELTVNEWTSGGNISWGDIEQEHIKKCLISFNDGSPVIIGDNEEPCLNIILSESNSYQFRFKALNCDISSLSIQAFANNNLQVPFKNIYDIESVGEYRSNRQALHVNLKKSSPLSGLFDYVLFSEKSLVKDIGIYTISNYGNFPTFPATGQTESYYSNDDGWLESGSPLSYTDNGDGTVTDNNTSLMWAQDTSNPNSGFNAEINWNQAIDYCINLDFAGYDDWYLPNIKELNSIVKYDANSNRSIDEDYFPNTPPYQFWSSTTFPPVNQYALVQSFAGPLISFAGKGNRYGFALRCVRNRNQDNSSDFLATGQTTSYRANDDGDLETGAVLSYTDNGDGTVKDNNTGLTWAKDGNGVGCNNGNTATWEDAIDYCINLDFAGYDDWYLPNVRELTSIVNYGNASSPRIDQNYFPHTKTSEYWSSTTDPDSFLRALSLSFSGGHNFTFIPKTDLKYLRCVRNVAGAGASTGDPSFSPPTDLTITSVEDFSNFDPDTGYTISGIKVTLDWNDEGYEYRVYQTEHPTLDISSWNFVFNDEEPLTPGFQIYYADSNNPEFSDNFSTSPKFFTVVADDNYDSQYIKKVGYIEYRLYPETNMISLPIDYGINTVSELGERLGLEAGDSVALWNNGLQDWETTFFDGINWEPDYSGIDIEYTSLLVHNAHDFKSVYLFGTVPEDEVSFSLSYGWNVIYLPFSRYDQGIDTCAEIGADISSSINMISFWNANYQGWMSCVYLSFFGDWINDSYAESGEPFMVYAHGGTWPY